MKFIHIADVHLGMKPDNNLPWSEIRQREIKETFLKVLDTCNEEGIDFLLIAGDLFHKQPLLRELKEINYAFSKLTSTKVVMIAGNHDFISERSHYTGFLWCEQVYMLDQQEMDRIYFPSFQLQVYGFSYHQRDITTQRYRDVFPEEKERINILLAHGGDEKNIPIDKNNLAKLGFDYVALGHIHKPEVLSQKIAYAGSLEPLDKNETGKHGFILGEITEGRKEVRIQFVPFAKREYIHLEIEINQEMTNGEIADYVKSKIESLGDHNIYKIIVRGMKDPDITLEERPIYALGNVIQVVDKTIPDYDFSELYYKNKDNLMGMYIDEIRHTQEPDDIVDKALYYGIEALLRAKE